MPDSQLARRPSATQVTVRQLIERANLGYVRVPKFQRPLRWKPSDVAKLFDSVWRGYPIGSLLFWKRPADAQTMLIGSASIPFPEVPDAWWVVDGQQRTVAFAATLLDLDHGNDDRWSLWFNPDSQEFLSRTEGSQCVPLSVLGDLRRLGRWLREHDLESKQVDILEDAQQRILDYIIPGYVVDTEDVGALRAIFARLNSTGKRMRADDVFQALVGSASGIEERVDLDVLQQAAGDDEFGVLSRGEILKAALAASNMDPVPRPDAFESDKYRERILPQQELEISLARATRFLRTLCFMPSSRLVPYPTVYTVLGKWFSMFPEAAEETQRRLAHWVWRSAIAAANTGDDTSNISSIRKQLGCLVAGDPEGSVDRLVALVPVEAPTAWTLKAFRGDAGRSRIEMLALLDKNPRDEFGILSLRAVVSGESIAKRVFAKSKGDGNMVSTVANRILLESGSTTQKQVVAWNGVDRGEILQSHVISGEAFCALRDGKREKFWELRARDVERVVLDFVRKKCGFGQPIVRPLSYYRKAST
ncbi:MAG: DUF262 domain-containing protein [Myxococcota bacterium]